MERERISSGTPWEDAVGYSRAVRVGPHVYVSGTTATNDAGEIAGVGDPYVQTKQVLENIRAALERLDATMDDVVRSTMYVTNIADWGAIGRAHAEFFGDVRPASTMVEVQRLVSPEMVVEIEVTAFVGDG